RTRGSSRCAASIAVLTCGWVEQSSTRHSSQSSNRWARTEPSIAASTSGGVSNTGVRSENRGPGTALPTPLAEAGGGRPDESRDTGLQARRGVDQAPRAGLQLGEPPTQRTQFGVSADQQIAQPQDLLPAAVELLAQLGGLGAAVAPGSPLCGCSLIGHGRRVYPAAARGTAAMSNDLRLLVDLIE